MIYPVTRDNEQLNADEELTMCTLDVGHRNYGTGGKNKITRGTTFYRKILMMCKGLLSCLTCLMGT